MSLFRMSTNVFEHMHFWWFVFTTFQSIPDESSPVLPAQSVILEKDFRWIGQEFTNCYCIFPVFTFFCLFQFNSAIYCRSNISSLVQHRTVLAEFLSTPCSFHYFFCCYCMSLHSRVFSCFFSATCFFQKSFAFLNPLLYSGRFFCDFFHAEFALSPSSHQLWLRAYLSITMIDIRIGDRVYINKGGDKVSNYRLNRVITRAGGKSKAWRRL